MEEFFMLIKPFVLPAHALLGAVGVGSTIATDVLFFQFMKDFKVSRTENTYAKAISAVFWIALIGLIITGIALFLSDPVKYSASSKFLTKSVAVLVITINGLVLNYILTPVLTKLHFKKEQSKKFTLFKQLSFLCGTISLVSWPLAFVLGSISKIPVTPVMGISLYFLLLCASGLFSQAIFYVKSQ